MKKCSVLFFLMAFSASLYAQAEPDLLVTDSTWGKEVFQFPINFAPGIPYEGFEEAYFPKHWADTTHAESWSYVFAWDIKQPKSLTARELEANLQLYYDGLMQWQHSKVMFLQKDDAGSTSNYTGEVKTLDAFFSKRPMTLYVSISVRHCSQQERSLVVFRLSPKAFEHDIWQKLNAVVLRAPDCAR